jgi:hypothetical protein
MTEKDHNWVCRRLVLLHFIWTCLHETFQWSFIDLYTYVFDFLYVHSFFPFYFLLLLFWVYIVTFTKFLTIYHSWIYSFFYSPSSPHPIPGIVSTGLIFVFTYICTQYWHHILPPTPSPYILPLSLVPASTKNKNEKPALASCSLIL